MVVTVMSVMVKRPIILCFIPFYLPGYRSGGPLRTIANLVDQLGDEFDIRIITRDRDVFDTKPYSMVKVDAWNTLGNAQVFYASKLTITLTGIAQLLRETPHDVLYLNSFFAFRFTALPLLAQRFGMAPSNPCVIAPRGEFSQGALAIKKWKKVIYMLFFRLLCFSDNLIWQASSARSLQIYKVVFVITLVKLLLLQTCRHRSPLTSRALITLLSGNQGRFVQCFCRASLL